MSTTSINQSYQYLPTQISGCVLWLDGADLTTLFMDVAGTTPVTASGQSVSFWKDKSTSGNNATNATNQPTVTYNAQNSRSVLNFDGSQYLSLTASKLPTGSTNFTFFLVPKTASSAVQVYFSYGTYPASTGQFPQFYLFNYQFYNDLYGVSGISDNGTYNNDYAIMATTAGTNFNAYINDTAFTNGNDLPITLNTGSDFAAIGVSLVGTTLNYYLNGQMAEIIAYDRVLTTNERQQITGYLAWKWGLQANLPISQPYRNYTPFMNTYTLLANPTSPIPSQNNQVFLPTQISGCHVWLDATDPNGNGIPGAANQLLGNWKDKSSNNFNSIASNAAVVSKSSVNGLDSIYFSGSQTGYVFSDATINSATHSFFFVAKPTTVTANTGYNFLITFQAPDGGEPYIVFPYFINDVGGAKGYITSYDGPALNYAGSTLVDNATANTVTLSAAIISNGDQRVFKYGVLQSSNNQELISLTSPFLYVGRYPLDSEYYFQGNVCEIIVYTSALSTAQQQQVEGYLAWKWGVQASLPSTHPYAKSPFPGLVSAPNPVFPPVIKSATWIPTQITGSSLWLDAADKTTLTGIQVTSWKDKSGSENTATSSSGPIQSTYEKYPVVSFNGISQFMSSANTVPRTAHTLIAVHRPAVINGNTQGNTSLFRYQVSNYIVFPYMNLTTPRGYITNADGAGVGSLDYLNSTLVENSVTSSLNIIMAVISTNSQMIYKNGVLQSSTSVALSGGISDSLVIGRWVNTEYYQGDLAEMIVYNNALSTTARQKVEGYLAWKWGLQGQLPGSHPYKLFPPSP